jgi:hypothetical protein
MEGERKQRGESRMKDDRKAGKRRENEGWQEGREEKGEWHDRKTGKRMKDDRKPEWRKQNERIKGKLSREEKEWPITGKQGGDGRMKDERKS